MTFLSADLVYSCSLWCLSNRRRGSYDVISQ